MDLLNLSDLGTGKSLFKPSVPYADNNYAKILESNKANAGDALSSASKSSEGFFSKNAGALIGAGASLAGTTAQVALGINQLRQNKKSLEQAKEALDFQKEQYANQKKNYDGYMQDTQASASAYNLASRKQESTQGAQSTQGDAQNTQKSEPLPMERE